MVRALSVIECGRELVGGVRGGGGAGEVAGYDSPHSSKPTADPHSNSGGSCNEQIGSGEHVIQISMLQHSRMRDGFLGWGGGGERRTLPPQFT